MNGNGRQMLFRSQETINKEKEIAKNVLVLKKINDELVQSLNNSQRRQKNNEIDSIGTHLVTGEHTVEKSAQESNFGNV